MKYKLKTLNDSFGRLVRNTCNVIGCANCGQKGLNEKEECMSDILYGKILDIEKKIMEGGWGEGL